MVNIEGLPKGDVCSKGTLTTQSGKPTRG